MLQTELEARLREAFPDAQIAVEDLAGDGDHYRARIVSTAFKGLPRVRLGSEVGLGAASNTVRVRVVGTFRPRDRAAWEGDPLAGEGYDGAYSDGSVTASAYGPFLVDDAALLRSGSSVTGLRVTARPRLSSADEPSLRTALDSLDHADALLSSQLTGRARITREAAMAKLFATDAAQEIIDDAVQIWGAAGLVSGAMTESLYREIRAMRIYEGASDVQKIVIARSLLTPS